MNEQSDIWTSRLAILKRLYRLMLMYFFEVLQSNPAALDIPDLHAMAKDYDVDATLIMCRMALVIGVRCNKKAIFIDSILNLSDTHQEYIMEVIQDVRLYIFLDNYLCTDCASGEYAHISWF